MNVLNVTLLDDRLVFEIGGGVHEVPAGVQVLADGIEGDPPAPEGLTNAIGLVIDHLDDVERELPMAAFADGIEIVGAGAEVAVAVEIGGRAALPFTLEREAAEDVFRTLATERAADRRHNPGLPGEWVHRVLGACCAIVAVMRHFRADTVVVREQVDG